MPAALNGAILSLQARHEKQHLLFFAESLIQLDRWHCHKAARADANLSVLSVLPRIGSGGSDGVNVLHPFSRIRVIYNRNLILCIIIDGNGLFIIE
jgi:hypothetical protein